MAPSLFVKPSPDLELGLFANTLIPIETELLPLHRASHLATDLRMWTLDRGVFLRSPSDLHSLIHHACIPSTYVDWETPCIRALREIHAQEEITVNYMTIYEVIATPFICHCGAPTCYGEVSGFHALSMAEKLKLELYLSPYLSSELTRQVLAFGAQAS